jgi:hypothetical protein
MNLGGFEGSGCDLFTFSSRNCFEGLMKTVEILLSHDIIPLGREPDPGPTDYDAGVLTNQPRLSVISFVNKIP